MLSCVLFHAGVSILEGGYDLDALQASALAHVKVLMNGYPHPGGSSPNAAGRLASTSSTFFNCAWRY